jgi:hypothetical protein
MEKLPGEALLGLCHGGIQEIHAADPRETVVGFQLNLMDFQDVCNV